MLHFVIASLPLELGQLIGRVTLGPSITPGLRRDYAVGDLDIIANREEGAN